MLNTASSVPNYNVSSWRHNCPGRATVPLPPALAPVLSFSPGRAECRLLTAGTWSGPHLSHLSLLSSTSPRHHTGDIRQSSAPGRGWSCLCSPLPPAAQPRLSVTTAATALSSSTTASSSSTTTLSTISPPVTAGTQQNKDQTAIAGSGQSTAVPCYQMGNIETN